MPGLIHPHHLWVECFVGNPLSRKPQKGWPVPAHTAVKSQAKCPQNRILESPLFRIEKVRFSPFDFFNISRFSTTDVQWKYESRGYGSAGEQPERCPRPVAARCVPGEGREHAAIMLSASWFCNRQWGQSAKLTLLSTSQRISKNVRLVCCRVQVLPPGMIDLTTQPCVFP